MKRGLFLASVLMLFSVSGWAQSKVPDCISIVNSLINAIGKPLPNGTEYSKENDVYVKSSDETYAGSRFVAYSYTVGNNRIVTKAAYLIAYSGTSDGLMTGLVWSNELSKADGVSNYPSKGAITYLYRKHTVTINGGGNVATITVEP